MEVGITSSGQPNGGVATEHQTIPIPNPPPHMQVKGTSIEKAPLFRRGATPVHKLPIIHMGLQVRTLIGGVVEANLKVTTLTLEITITNMGHNIREVLLYGIMTILPPIQLLSNTIIPH